MCGIGRGTSSTLAYKIKEIYWNYINEIKTVDYIGLKKYDFTGVDLLISSIPIKYSLPIPMIEVNYFLNDNDKKTQNRSKLFLNTELTEKTNFDIVPTVVN